LENKKNLQSYAPYHDSESIKNASATTGHMTTMTWGCEIKNHEKECKKSFDVDGKIIHPDASKKYSLKKRISYIRTSKKKT